MPFQEIGTVPGSYRIIDLFCFREVLSQITKLSCRCDGGFGLYQDVDQVKVNSFHSVLDMICHNCNRKVSFGTSTIVDNMVGSAVQKPDIDVKMNFFSDSFEERGSILSSLWSELHGADNRESCWLETNTVDVDQDGSMDLFPDTNLEPTRSEDEVFDGILRLPDADSPNKTEDTVTHVIVPIIRENQRKATSGRSCQLCGKEFKKAYNLKQHIRIHTNEKPLKCDHCDKRFNDRSSMNKHTRTVHVDFKPHSCQVCGKSFASTSHLNEHMVKHTNQRNYQCDNCSKKFSFRSSLTKHMNGKACTFLKIG